MRSLSALETRDPYDAQARGPHSMSCSSAPLLTSSMMMASSTEVPRSCLEVGLFFFAVSYKLLASVTLHWFKRPCNSQSWQRTATKGSRDFCQSGLITSPWSISLYITCSHSNSDNDCEKAKASPARVGLTLRRSLADLQERMDTLQLVEAEGIASEAMMIQAPWVVSVTAPGSSDTGKLSTPPASDAAMKIILLLSKRCNTKGCWAVLRRRTANLFKQDRS